jgi:uroporphyrinogen-III decarboxylase
LKITYEGVKIFVKEKEDYTRVLYETPLGTLSSTTKKAEGGMSSRVVEFPLKEVDDLKVWEYVLERRKVEFNEDAFEKFEEELRGQGMLWYSFPRIPLQRLFIQLMGIERTVKFLYRYPSKIEGLMETMEAVDDEVYEIIGDSPFEVVNFGDNLDSRLISPSLFTKYYLPHYQKRSEELHRKDKFVLCHVDGYAKNLLPFFKETGWDGVEALTTKPTGDITLEEIKDALGDELVLVDGIPFYYFLPIVSLKEFERFTRHLIDKFPNNLILGISDQMPPMGDIKKVHLVSQIIEGAKV